MSLKSERFPFFEPLLWLWTLPPSQQLWQGNQPGGRIATGGDRAGGGAAAVAAAAAAAAAVAATATAAGSVHSSLAFGTMQMAHIVCARAAMGPAQGRRPSGSCHQSGKVSFFEADRFDSML